MSKNEAEAQDVQAGSEDEEQVPVHIDIPDELKIGTYANHVVISRTPLEFVITFAQIMPLRDKEAIKEAVEARRLEAVAVASIVIDHALLPSIIEAFQSNLSRLEEGDESD